MPVIGIGGDHMPISWSVDVERHVIRVKWRGIVTAGDLGNYFRKMMSDANALAICRCIADLRGAEIQLSGRDVQAVIRDVVRPLLGGRTWTSAIVADDAVAFGTSRQYEAYSQGFNRSAIFDDEVQALAWLLASPEMP